MRLKGLQLRLFSLFCFVLSSCNGQPDPAAENIEKLIANAVDKAMASSVYIIEWDTLKNQVQKGIEETSGFTGVVVSAEGHILTVSHAAMPNQIYRVSFPDGSKHIAVGLGRIGLEDGKKDYDMAMVKILKPGKWPFAKMARSQELKINQPVVSISYPGAFFKQTPNVRFGRISDIDLSDGFIESSAKMEPGDSGGPLFDVQGRVVGIHSWIREKEDQNYDVPADHFLKYWTALNVAKDYTEFPTADELPAAVASAPMQTVPSLEEVAGVSVQNRKSAVVVRSSRGTQQLSILGTLLGFNGATYIVSKSSMVGNNPRVKAGNSTVTAQILKRDKENDLVLLSASGKMEGGIMLATDTKDPVLKQGDLGKILISAIANDSIKVGVLSATYLDVPLNASQAYLGAGAAYQDGKITIRKIDKNSSGGALLQRNDQIVKINDVTVNTAADYNREFAKYMAGDSISMNIVRKGKPMQLSICLEALPTEDHASYAYPGGRSVRSDGFRNVLVHDAAIKTTECGSPVFDSDGNFYGVNIARRSRTSTLLMPVSTLSLFLKTLTNSK